MTHSAGIIPYKFEDGKIRFFVGHPGGSNNRNKNYWALLKGTMENGEDTLDTALREFGEESGLKFDIDEWKERMWLVGTVKQRSDKIVTAYAIEVNDIDVTSCFSNLVYGETFPEIDKYAWLTIGDIRKCTSKSNVWFYEEIMANLGIDESD